MNFLNYKITFQVENDEIQIYSMEKVTDEENMIDLTEDINEELNQEIADLKNQIQDLNNRLNRVPYFLGD